MISQKRLNTYIDQLNELIRTGFQMSNICFNLSQREGMDENDRDCMQKCYKQWDAISRKAIDGMDSIIDDYETLRKQLNKSKQKTKRPMIKRTKR